MKHHATFWSLLLTALLGCSKPSLPPPPEFSQRIVTADRLVVTNRLRAFGATITGGEVGQIARAVASARQNTSPAAAMYDWEVAFYAGTNFLSVIHLQSRGFVIGDVEYTDHTEVLNSFWEKWKKEANTR